MFCMLWHIVNEFYQYVARFRLQITEAFNVREATIEAD